MRAGEREGWLISRREQMGQPQVVINAKTGAEGCVAAELLDSDGKVLSGFSRDDCARFRGDSIRHVLKWKAGHFEPSQGDGGKRIRFILRNADLFSYFVVPPEDPHGGRQSPAATIPRDARRK